MRSFGRSAFNGCASLVMTEYKNALYIGGKQNKHLVLVKATNTDISDISVHPDCRIIMSNAFQRCVFLEDTIISDSVTYIDSYAFNNCTALTIYASADSAAEEFAEDKGIKFQEI